jgi:hypothetical protein
MCGCPGDVWNFNIPYKPWVNFTSSDHSKRLMHTGYGFNIPATASVTGIQIDFDYTTNGATNGVLKDSNAVLLMNGAMAGNDLSNATGYYLNGGHITLGGPGNLWGLQPSPADINSSGFGFNVRFYCTNIGTILTFENGVTITVHYVNAAGIHESQSGNSWMKTHLKNRELQIDYSGNEKVKTELFDLTGKLIYSTTFEGSGTYNYSLESLHEGVYLYRLSSNNHKQSGRLVLN